MACGSKSVSPSPFFELELNLKPKGTTTLRDCLEQLLAVERLEGDNQYLCSHCSDRVGEPTKSDATRQTRITQLPEILNVQLMRFIFANGIDDIYLSTRAIQRK